MLEQSRPRCPALQAVVAYSVTERLDEKGRESRALVAFGCPVIEHTPRNKIRLSERAVHSLGNLLPAYWGSINQET